MKVLVLVLFFWNVLFAGFLPWDLKAKLVYGVEHSDTVSEGLNIMDLTFSIWKKIEMMDVFILPKIEYAIVQKDYLSDDYDDQVVKKVRAELAIEF